MANLHYITISKKDFNGLTKSLVSFCGMISIQTNKDICILLLSKEYFTDYINQSIDAQSTKFDKNRLLVSHILKSSQATFNTVMEFLENHCDNGVKQLAKIIRDNSL